MVDDEARVRPRVQVVMSRMSQARRAITRVARDPSLTRIEALERLAKLKTLVEEEESAIETDLRKEDVELKKALGNRLVTGQQG